MTEGTLLPGVVDHHVHLGLVNRNLLADTAVVQVHDLGWDPKEAVAFCDQPPHGVEVGAVGPFHTAPGGYPTGRAWAPPASVRALRDPDEASAAVAEVVSGGFNAVKITLHADFPILEDDVLAALIDATHAAGLRALVHAEGKGMVERAVTAGADTLVHAPWTEQVPDDILLAGAQMTWISTLAIHDRAGMQIAIDNIARFRAVGGRVVYGTDMGNGPTPVGVNDAELRALGRAGLRGEDLIAAVTGGAPCLTALLPRPGNAEELIAWLAAATRTTPEESR